MTSVADFLFSSSINVILTLTQISFLSFFWERYSWCWNISIIETSYDLLGKMERLTWIPSHPTWFWTSNSTLPTPLSPTHISNVLSSLVWNRPCQAVPTANTLLTLAGLCQAASLWGGPPSAAWSPVLHRSSPVVQTHPQHARTHTHTLHLGSDSQFYAALCRGQPMWAWTPHFEAALWPLPSLPACPAPPVPTAGGLGCSGRKGKEKLFRNVWL